MNKSFKDEPFNNVDGLVFAQLSYIRLEYALRGMAGELGFDAGDIVRTEEADSFAIPVKEFYRAEYFEEMFSDGITDRENKEFFTAIAASPRFRNIEVRNLVSETDVEDEKQFAAMIFEIDDETEYVAFRGTDGSLLGWKEDFNMSFMDEVPSQIAAARYMNEHFAEGDGKQHKKLYLGGHSKGGNLALYAATMCDDSIHDKIKIAFSFEGPGFREETAKRVQEIADRETIEFRKFVPQSSLIGMIMESPQGMSAVESKAIGIFQHSAYTWQIEMPAAGEDAAADFKYTAISYGGAYNDRTLRNWLENVPDEDREAVIDNVFDILAENEIKSVHDLKRLNPAKLSAIIDTYTGMGDEAKQAIKRSFIELGKTAIREIPTGKGKKNGATGGN